MSTTSKIAYITGGSTGIGLAIAQKLAQENYTVCLFARDSIKLDRAQALINNTGATCYTYSVDATDFSSVQETMNYAVHETGTPHMLINCVGRALPHCFENIGSDMMMDTMQANVGSAWNAIQAILPHMKAKGRGKIVNTSSVGGFVGIYGYTDYSASKFALIGFSESLRQELKRFNIQVQVLCPPDTDTPGLEIENRTKPEETRRISESASLMTSDDVAAYAVRAMRRDRFMIIPGFQGKLTYMLKRYCPIILTWIFDGIVTKVHNERAAVKTPHTVRLRNLAQAS